MLILDNCEHVIAEAAALAHALACLPALRILATSREPLRIAGEQTYRLPSLRVPPPAEIAGLNAVQAAEFPAVVLFAQREQEIDRGFTLRDDNASIVAKICSRRFRIGVLDAPPPRPVRGSKLSESIEV